MLAPRRRERRYCDLQFQLSPTAVHHQILRESTARIRDRRTNSDRDTPESAGVCRIVVSTRSHNAGSILVMSTLSSRHRVSSTVKMLRSGFVIIGFIWLLHSADGSIDDEMEKAVQMGGGSEGVPLPVLRDRREKAIELGHAPLNRLNQRFPVHSHRINGSLCCHDGFVHPE